MATATMNLEERMGFKEALLAYLPEESWRLQRPHHLRLFQSHFSLEGRTVTGRELVDDYAQRFPAEKDYLLLGHWNRMLDECGIPRFSFAEPSVLHGFLCSVKPESAWVLWEPSLQEFGKMRFQYHGINLRGQMLLNNAFVEIENKKHGTYYVWHDYMRHSDLIRTGTSFQSRDSLLQLFDMAGVETRHKDIAEELLDQTRLREILLSVMDDAAWKKWTGNANAFDRLRFDIDSHRVFSGEMLRNAYSQAHGKPYSVKDIFDEAEIHIGSDPELIRSRKQQHFGTYYGVFDAPETLRELLLQIQPEEDWKKPQLIGHLRKRKVDLDGRKITLHTLMMLYSVHKQNKPCPDITDWATLNEVQDHRKAGLQCSSRAMMDELLAIAGIPVTWKSTIPDVDLSDANYLRRLIFHATYQGRPVSVNEIKSMNMGQFRKVQFNDPETGLHVFGHALMIYVSAYDAYKQQSEFSLEYVAQKLGKGKSNAGSRKIIFTKAGL